jgi:hypothetical protein
MKNVTLIIVVFFASMVSGYSKVWTVSNDSTRCLAQYYNLQNVIDNLASNGDTIMVAGTSTVLGDKSYGDIYIRKSLTIIGAGDIIYGKIKNYTLFSIIYIDVSNVIIIACKMSSINSSYLKVANNVTVTRSIFNFIVLSGDSIKIYNNYFGYVTINNHSHVFISNNIMNSASYGLLYNSDKSSVIVSNNILSYNSSGWIFYNISNALISNNIMFASKIRHSSTDPAYCFFNNNLTYKADNDTIPFGYNYGANNIIGIDPKFEGWNASTGLYSINVWEKDFRLKSDSPGKNAGDDGKDIGIYGGAYPWSYYYIDGTNNNGEASLPAIRDLNILNRVVGKNGKIKFRVKGEAVK